MTPNHFVVSFGLATDSLAEVYLRQTHGPTDALNGARIDVRGPFCSIAKTLKTNTSFERFQEREVWRARIVDPCFWSPDYPAFYRIRIQVAEQTTELICGLRRFGAKHGQLWLEGKRWVLRAAHQSHVPNATLQEWRAARLTMLAEDSPQTLLESAAKEGVMLVVDLDRQDWSDRLRKAASWPAVAIAVVPASTSLQECRRQALTC